MWKCCSLFRFLTVELSREWWFLCVYFFVGSLCWVNEKNQERKAPATSWCKAYVKSTSQPQCCATLLYASVQSCLRFESLIILRVSSYTGSCNESYRLSPEHQRAFAHIRIQAVPRISKNMESVFGLFFLVAIEFFLFL